MTKLMDKYKYQVLVIIIALAIGAGVGHFSTVNSKHRAIQDLVAKHKIEIQKEIKLNEKRIQHRDSLIAQKEKQSSEDSLLISKLEKQIATNKVVVQKKVEEVKNLNSTEKEQWLIDRYKNEIKPVSTLPITLSIPEPVVTNVIQELIIKDGLIVELNKKDSVVTIYKTFVDKQRQEIALLKLNEEDYKKIINGKDQLLEFAQAELKDQKKQVNKLKLKNVLLGLGVGIETIVVILLLL